MHNSRLNIQKWLNLLFPVRCTLCKKSGTTLCSDCLIQLQPVHIPLCQICHTPLTKSGSCKRCAQATLHINGLCTVGYYEKPLSSCIHALKYNGQTNLAQPLGRLLAQVYRAYQLQLDIAIPVPLHHTRYQQRGFNQAQLLATVCAQELNLPLRTDLIQRIHATESQVHLSVNERRKNVTGTFQCSNPQANSICAGRKILLVDDVCTTGSTLEACSAPLFLAGASEVWGIVLAQAYY